MGMRWLEGELRNSGIPGDQKRADDIRSMLKDRGKDIALPVESSLSPLHQEEHLVTERNPDGYLNLIKELLRIKRRAPYHQPLRERLHVIANDPKEFDQLANSLELIIEGLTLREQEVLIARKALQGQGSVPEPAILVAERFGINPDRILGIEKIILRKLRHNPGLEKIKLFFSDL